MFTDISVVILVKNAAHIIGECLEALVEFDDVIVYDNGSTDGTQAICAAYSNVRLIEGEFLGFGPTKNIASSFAKYNWIFSLDSDEVLSEELIKTLKSTNLVANHIYGVERRNFYKNKEVKYAWNNDIVLRLYHQQNTQFNDNLVHESLTTDNFKIEILKGQIYHHSYHSISDFIHKTDRYSTLFAEQNKGKQNSTPFKAVSHACFAMFKTYILKKGFLDGYIGLIIAYSQASEKFYKYMKLYERNKDA